MRRRGAQRARRRRGFTLVEVMISLGVMTIGAMAVVAMQTHVIHLNEFVRSSAIAENIGQAWIERLKQDAATWVNVGFNNTPGQPTANDVLANTTYLRSVLANPAQYLPIPATANPTPSDVFDFVGMEMPTGSTGGTYCVAYRLQWVYYGRALRADVRVIWPREDLTSRNQYFGKYAGACTAQLQGDVDPPNGALQTFVHTLYLSTVIRQTPFVR